MSIHEFDNVDEIFEFIRKAEDEYLEDHTIPPILPGTYWLCVTHLAEGLVIFGISKDSEYEEDEEPIEDARKRGYIFGEWFSEVCPYPDHGEWGSNHIGNCVPITESFFMAYVPRR